MRYLRRLRGSRSVHLRLRLHWVGPPEYGYALKDFLLSYRLATFLLETIGLVILEGACITAYLEGASH